ncbi:zinc-binding dehydrogenase [Nocardioides cheoyonin]|uniref:zinc-binding dehydrogenase n=1 Tax=Nocardioides cheoyonin TaxID=3156615 RepID=UPI0032B3597B
MTMRAATISRPGVMEVRDFPTPTAAYDGEVVVRMERGSICGSDVHALYDGLHNEDFLGRPGYPGHEGVGTVVESRSAAFPIGRRVLTVPMGSEGGCFAAYMLISDRYLVDLPPGGDAARLLMAQQYGTTLYAMRQIWPEKGNTGVETGIVAVVGAGSAGLFFLQQLRRLGFEQIVVSDLDDHRLAVARRLGAAVCVRAPGGSVVEAVRDLSGGAGADLVIEAAGYDACRADAVAAVRPLGTIGCFGFPERLEPVPFPQYDAFRKLVRIQWAGGAQAEPGLVTFRDALRDIDTGAIEVDYCLGSAYDLERLPEAMVVARDLGHGAVKLAVDIGSASAG